MPSDSLCVSCPLSFKERWAWPSRREGQEPAEAPAHPGFCMALSPWSPGLNPHSASSPRCPVALEGLTKGQALQDPLPDCSFGLSVAFCGWWSGARERPPSSGWNRMLGFNEDSPGIIVLHEISEL